MIELRTLAYFVSACRCETLAHAASQLGIAPSTLTTTLKTLEKELGLQLFGRLGAGLYPTADARWLLRLAEPLVSAEAFARRWVSAPRRRGAHVLRVHIAISFTVGRVGAGLQQAIDTMALERPDILVDRAWTDERDLPRVDGLAEAWRDVPGSELTIDVDVAHPGRGKHEVLLLTDPWIYAARLPAGTRRPARAAELAAGRLVVPALAQPLIEQADRYFRQHRMRGIRFVSEYPGEVPRLLDQHPDAALFVPRSLISARLGLLRVHTVAPDPPLETSIVARVPAPDGVTALFLRHLRRALAEPPAFRAPRPVISMRQIRYFNAVHRLRRVSAAAYGAAVSQPSLTEQMHKLEAALGTALFERRGDGVVPTPDGERFAAVAKLIEAGAHRLADGEALSAAPLSRRIRFGILPSVSQHGLLVNRVTEAVLGVQSRHPTLRLVIQEAPNGALQDWVMRGLVGVAIVETSLPHMPRLPLGSSEELAVIAHPRHRLLPPGPVRFADVARLPLVLPTNRFGLRQLLESAADEHGIVLRPQMEIDALTMTAAALVQWPICTVLPPSAVRRELADGDLVAHPIIEPVVARRLFVIYSGERTLSEPERDLVQALRARLADTDVTG